VRKVVPPPVSAYRANAHLLRVHAIRNTITITTIVIITTSEAVPSAHPASAERADASLLV
jgi:hypothetical protein